MRFRPQPELVEAPLGAKEHWFETFRRVVVAPLDDSCYLVSMDVYAPECPCSEFEGELELGSVRLLYCKVDVEALDHREKYVVELVCLDVSGEREAISARMVLCGEEPGRSKLWSMYRATVKKVEGRDPEEEPLDSRLKE